MPCGGGIWGGQTHSQSPEALFTHVCGLRTVLPSNPYDAKGLLISSIENDDPVIFLEYAVDVAAACRESGVKTVAVTAGYIGGRTDAIIMRIMDGMMSIPPILLAIAAVTLARLARTHKSNCRAA